MGKFFEYLKNNTTDLLINFGTRFIYVLVALVIGFFAIRILRKIISKVINKTSLDISAKDFLKSVATVVLWLLLVVLLGTILGIETSAFFTIFGAVGIAIGLALQGSLTNFAGGLLLLIFKPFKVGDEILVDEVRGLVLGINILYTQIDDWRGEVIYIPNGKLMNMKVQNNSASPNRRIEMELRLPLNIDFDRATEVVSEAMKSHELTLKDKPFQLRFKSINEYYILASARCWCKTEFFWNVKYDVHELIKKALEKEEIQLSIPKHEISFTKES